MQCVVDGVCDGETCEDTWTCEDCVPDCELVSVTGPPAEYLVSSFIAPTSIGEAWQMGVDLDGDGDIDNKWGQVSKAISNNVAADLNEEIAAEIAAGRLLIAARIYPNQTAEFGEFSMVQLLLAEVHDATPLFDGLDEVRLAANASSDVGLCGSVSEQRFGSPFSSTTVRFPVTWPGRGGTLVAELQPILVGGDLSESGWYEIHVGGGLSPEHIRDALLPVAADLINHTIVAEPDSDEARTLVDLFDGSCVVIDGVPGCEAVVSGEGECDYRTDPPVITVEELKCNALLNAAMAPDVDIDGDGVNDVLSFGVRLSAVPVTIVE